MFLLGNYIVILEWYFCQSESDREVEIVFCIGPTKILTDNHKQWHPTLCEINSFPVLTTQ